MVVKQPRALGALGAAGLLISILVSILAQSPLGLSGGLGVGILLAGWNAGAYRYGHRDVATKVALAVAVVLGVSLLAVGVFSLDRETLGERVMPFVLLLSSAITAGLGYRRGLLEE